MFIGHTIKTELEKQGRGPTWLAQRLYCNRSNIYKIYTKRSIDTELLGRISIILQKDFFSLYSQEYINLTQK